MNGKIIIEVDGVRHVATRAYDAGNCNLCSLKDTCRHWLGMPCDVFEVGCCFRKQTLPPNILSSLLALASEVNEMRSWQRKKEPTEQDLKIKARTEVRVDTLLKKIEGMWDKELEGL